MDKIEKFLRKLSKKEQEAFLLLLNQLKIDFRKIPGILKLQNQKNIYRIRIGRHRIILKVYGNRTEIIKITKRDDQTYKNLQ